MDPSGYFVDKPTDEERRKIQEGAKVNSELAYKWWSITNPQLYGNSYLSNSFTSEDEGEGDGIVVDTHYDWRTGKTHNVYEDPLTGNRYYLDIYSIGSRAVSDYKAETQFAYRRVYLDGGLGQAVSQINPYFRAFENAYNVANIGVAGSAIAMQSIRLNTNIHLRIGNLPNYWARYSLPKNISSGRAASYLGYGFVGFNLILDSHAYNSGKISAAELGFNTMTNLYGVYIGTAIGGPAGFLMGGMFDGVIWGIKQFYKSFVKPSFEGIYWHMYNLTHPF